MSQQEQVTIGWDDDDDDIHFVLVSFSLVLAHNSLQLDIVVPLRHIILIPGQPNPTTIWSQPRLPLE
jgi:hypothetical protein